jgi:hypothetical protein
MDESLSRDEQKAKLLDAKAFIQEWFRHPITVELMKENLQQETGLIQIITQMPVDSFDRIAPLVEAKGELRGIRRWRGLVEEKLQEIEDKLKEL